MISRFPCWYFILTCDVSAKLDGVKTYMRIRKVPSNLQIKVIKWFDYLWLSQKSTDEERSISCLPGNNLPTRNVPSPRTKSKSDLPIPIGGWGDLTYSSYSFYHWVVFSLDSMISGKCQGYFLSPLGWRSQWFWWF